MPRLILSSARADGEAAQWLGRMGTIEEAGKLCLFIASEASFTTAWITSSLAARSWLWPQNAFCLIRGGVHLE